MIIINELSQLISIPIKDASKFIDIAFFSHVRAKIDFQTSDHVQFLIDGYINDLDFLIEELILEKIDVFCIL